MPHFKLEHVKTYSIGAYSIEDNYCRGYTLWKDMRENFNITENIGMIFFKDGSVETLGSINVNAGQCDCCGINHDEIKKIELFKFA